MEQNLVLKPAAECDKLSFLRTEIEQASREALQQKIFDTPSKDAALSIGAGIKRLRKVLHERRCQITDPLQDVVKQVIAFEKSLDAPLEKAEDHIRSQAIAYANQIAEAKRIEEAKIAAEKIRIERENEAQMRAAAAMADSHEEQLADQKRVEQETKNKKSELAIKEREVKANAVKGTKEVWTYKIEDASLVPDEYWVIDESMIRNAVTKQKVRSIPGVKIFSETKVQLGSY